MWTVWKVEKNKPLGQIDILRHLKKDVGSAHFLSPVIFLATPLPSLPSSREKHPENFIYITEF